MFNDLILSGQLWTYIADLYVQTQESLYLIVDQTKEAEGVNEELKASNQMAWVIRNRTKEIILRKMIRGEYVVEDYRKNFGMATSSLQSTTLLLRSIRSVRS